jgi:hypothetical protein
MAPSGRAASLRNDAPNGIKPANGAIVPVSAGHAALGLPAQERGGSIAFMICGSTSRESVSAVIGPTTL